MLELDISRNEDQIIGKTKVFITPHHIYNIVHLPPLVTAVLVTSLKHTMLKPTAKTGCCAERSSGTCKMNHNIGTMKSHVEPLEFQPDTD